jgi:enoyl-CoA hydratase/carnithine racemase
MEYTDIKVEEREDGIGIITLNRPAKRNAITIQMRREISACLNEWKQSSHVGAVIFTGAGSAFSSGFDLTEFMNEALFDELFDSSSRYHRDVWYFPKPTIAAVNGPAMGGGFDLAIFCDIRICSGLAAFGHPEIKFGAPPIFTPLKWIVGEGMARDLCMSGRKIDFQAAFRMGLVSEIVESGELLLRAIQIGKEILEAPTDTIKFVKEYFSGNAGKGFEESFHVEHDRAFQDVLLPKAKNGFKRANS